MYGLGQVQVVTIIVLVTSLWRMSSRRGTP
jgi:hypothetical protein